MQTIPSQTISISSFEAQLLYALFQLEGVGMEDCTFCTANNLIYLFQRIGEPSRFSFTMYQLGPYTVAIEQWLMHLKGKYLKGLPQQPANKFQQLRLNYEKWYEIKNFIENEITQAENTRLQNLLLLTRGFHSELALQLLVTVDFLLQENSNYSFEQIIQNDIWNHFRKEHFEDEYVQIAYEQLMKYRNLLA